MYKHLTTREEDCTQKQYLLSPSTNNYILSYEMKNNSISESLVIKKTILFDPITDNKKMLRSFAANMKSTSSDPAV